MKRLLILAALAACAPAEGPEAAGAINDPDSAAAPGPLPTAQPVSLPPLSLRPFHDAERMLDSIQVLRGGQVVQTLVPPSDDVDPAPEPGSDVDTVDINFDGYPDVQQRTIWAAGSNTAHHWWLFDADSARFVYSPEYSEKVMAYRVDAAKREIVVHATGGHAGAIFEEYVYQPRGRELVRIRSVQQDALAGTESYVRVTGRLEGGAWVETADTLTVDELRAGQDSSGG